MAPQTEFQLSRIPSPPEVRTGRAATRGARHSSDGFTLVELMIGAGLSSLLLAALLTAFIFFCKTGLAMGNYHDLESDGRTVLQMFAQDAREAEGAQWMDAHTLRLMLDGTFATYTYDPQTGTLTRAVPGEPENILASGVQDLEFRAYTINGHLLALNGSALADTSLRTKMVQILADLHRPGTPRGPETSTRLASSRYMLRNKSVAAP